MGCKCTPTQQTEQQLPQRSSHSVKTTQSQSPSGMDHMECHHRRQTQERGTKFTWPQVYLKSFLRSNPQCSCIHKNRRREKQHSPLIPQWDICKAKQQQAVQELEKPGKFCTLTTKKKKKKKENPIGKDNQTTNFSSTVLMNFQTGSDYQIVIRQSGKSQFFPNCLDEFPNWIRLPNCDLTSVKSQFFPDRLDEFPNRVWLPNCELMKCQITIFPWPF